MTTLPKLALSVRQPWAWAIIHAGKDIENRDWRNRPMGLGKDCLNHRGPTAIHASKSMTRREYEEAAEFIATVSGLSVPLPADLLRGGIVGTVEIVDVVKQHSSPWFFGPKGLVLANPRPCEFVPAQGDLFYFAWKEGDPSAVPVPNPWMLKMGSRGEQPKPSQYSLVDYLASG